MYTYQSLPFISIIVPLYNGEKTIINCVESLLDQKYLLDRFEIIIIDNNSTDKSTELLKTYVSTKKVLLVSEKEILNAYGARNKGIKFSKGEILAFTDADCIADQFWLSNLQRSFQDMNVGCVAGPFDSFQFNNTIQKYYGKNFYGNDQKDTKKILGGNCAYRRSVIQQIGNFRTDIPSGGDTELAIRMEKQTKFKVSINLEALVYHNNISTISKFIKQFMRYGTQRWIFENNNKNDNTIFEILTIIFRTFVYLAVFIKRLIIVLFHVQQYIDEDIDIFIFRPILRLIAEWSSLIGSKIAVKNPNVLR